MAETLRSNNNTDGLLTLTECAAASNIPAGTPVALLTGSTMIYTLGDSTPGFSCTALMGHHFIGITEEDYSAGDSPVTIWTKGVFKLQTASGCSATNTTNTLCQAVFADSGRYVNIGHATTTGDAAIGTLVIRAASGSSSWCGVKINPGMWRRMKYMPNSTTATSYAAFGFPKLMT